MEISICTYFDHRYISRALLLYESIERHMPGVRLYALALTPECLRILYELSLPNLKIVALEDLEKTWPDLIEVKSNRSIIEYYFTLSPYLPLYLFHSGLVANNLFYMDADGLVFNDIRRLKPALENATVGITPHRFPPDEKYREEAGKFNVGFQFYSGDAESIQILDWWRERCTEWCYDRFEADRYADQKYLDRWPELSARVAIIEDPGVNAAPWNLSNYELSLVPEKSSNNQKQIMVSGNRLFYFHFQGLRRVGSRLYRTGLEHYAIFNHPKLHKQALGLLYRPYVKALHRAELKIYVWHGKEKSRVLRYQSEKINWVEAIKGMIRSKIIFSP